MSITFSNSAIENHFYEIWRYLYLEDGRMENPPINSIDLNVVDYYNSEEISNSDSKNNSLIRISQDKTVRLHME